ncbi:hypothetical protein ACFL2T_01190 [Elusimicrobiota bacterium]
MMEKMNNEDRILEPTELDSSGSAGPVPAARTTHRKRKRRFIRLGRRPPTCLADLYLAPPLPPRATKAGPITLDDLYRPYPCTTVKPEEPPPPSPFRVDRETGEFIVIKPEAP